MALATQTKIGVCLRSDGETAIDPDGAGVPFEMPIAKLPEDMNELS
jgi:hypothetical protein